MMSSLYITPHFNSSVKPFIREYIILLYNPSSQFTLASFRYSLRMGAHSEERYRLLFREPFLVSFLFCFSAFMSQKGMCAWRG
ncbi:hypothetical protein BDQ12DRAFT_677090 [Crucibulum laeve]|uniref:Uncharacterized protein n=1 Tax=Crucibulum laeve TaxID=68775 RepID=A0A5C3MBX8_9AGAR|nr:hypothetical protein BDQ12DRAFT_677090 [Crucibulum laeve]